MRVHGATRRSSCEAISFTVKPSATLLGGLLTSFRRFQPMRVRRYFCMLGVALAAANLSFRAIARSNSTSAFNPSRSR